jgi:hypothetical protein
MADKHISIPFIRSATPDPEKQPWDLPAAVIEPGHCWWCGQKRPHRVSIYSLPAQHHPTIRLCRSCVQKMADAPEGDTFGIWSNKP